MLITGCLLELCNKPINMLNFGSKKILIKNSTENKTFSYSKGKVSLNFTLRTDIKEEMKSFLELLEEAQADVQNQLEKL